jgi:hypothetical protein
MFFNLNRVTLGAIFYFVTSATAPHLGRANAVDPCQNPDPSVSCNMDCLCPADAGGSASYGNWVMCRIESSSGAVKWKVYNCNSNEWWKVNRVYQGPDEPMPYRR